QGRHRLGPQAQDVRPGVEGRTTHNRRARQALERRRLDRGRQPFLAKDSSFFCISVSWLRSSSMSSEELAFLGADSATGTVLANGEKTPSAWLKAAKFFCVNSCKAAKEPAENASGPNIRVAASRIACFSPVKRSIENSK